MIKVIDVSHHYGVRPVLSHINLEVRAGELLVVMGPNGVGKSTLLGIIAGLIAPAKGYVEVNGLRRREREEIELQIRRQVGFLPDHPWLPEFMTGREWLLAIGELYDIDPDRFMDHIPRVLELFQLSDKGDAPIRTYSNGQKKKIAICGVLVSEAPILILDEPFTGGLDASAILALSRLLKHLADCADVTVVLASQVPEIVENLAHRIAILGSNRLVACDTMERLRAQTSGSGSLLEVFEELVNPETLEHIESYFNRPKV
ncbi:MAG: ABC transporter ATP-binding protein [Verrucomicrobia subdivision 3 bacterium]|nr:ABC transporter ATP-binding protein [Limisphaerales bacterium]